VDNVSVPRELLERIREFAEKRCPAGDYIYDEVSKLLDTNPQPTDPVTIDWDKVPEGFDWVAMDGDGRFYCANVEPKPRLLSWGSDRAVTNIRLGCCSVAPGTDWRTTLRERPVKS